MQKITYKRIVHSCNAKVNNILFELQQPKKNIVKCNDYICSNCESNMTIDDTEYICTNCGMKGVKIESVPASYSNTSIKCYNNAESKTVGNGACNSLNDNGNFMYDATMQRLKNMYNKSPDVHIPLEILRQTARQYIEIDQALKETNKRNNGVLGVQKNQRNNKILPALLKQCLDKANMSKPKAHICQFIGKSKSVLTRSENKLLEITKNDGPVYRVDSSSKISSFAYLLLARLDLDTSLTDVIMHIILRADNSFKKKDWRPCRDDTKVVGTIWLLIRQIGYHVSHNKIYERCFKISKSTYARYVDLLDRIRRRINPILIKYRIRPIPPQFSNANKGSCRKKLNPLPEKYASLFITAD